MKKKEIIRGDCLPFKNKGIKLSHPKDISTALSHLVQEKMLIKKSETRAGVYHLPDQKREELFQTFFEEIVGSSPDLKIVLSKILKSFGYDHMPGKLDSDKMRAIILELCNDRFLSLKEISEIIERDPKSIQEQYLTKMVAEELLLLKFTDIKNHPEQAYKKIIKLLTELKTLGKIKNIGSDTKPAWVIS